MPKKKTDIFEKLFKVCTTGTIKEKQRTVGIFPKLVDIELTNCCNMRCKMCPTGSGTVNRTVGYMDTRLIDKILTELSKFKTPVRFIRWGEPMLHPAIYDILRQCKEYGIYTHINTNGWMLSPNIAKSLVATGVDSIKISMQGHDRQSYALVRGMDFFVQLCDDIRGLVLARGKSKTPRIVVGTTVSHETPAAKKVGELHKVVDKVYVGKTLDLAEKRDPPKVCPEVWDKLSIDWDGKVTCCCGDYDNFMTVGDLENQTLREIWVGEKAKGYRKKLAEHNYEGLALCQRCARGI